MIDSDRLAELRRGLNVTLAAMSPVSRVPVPRSRNRSDADVPGEASRRARGGSLVFLDDERPLRALAKEIKRLISEDIRRGIGL